MFGEKILIYTTELKWLLEHGLIITKFYKFQDVTILHHLVMIKDFFDLYIHCFKENTQKLTELEVMAELQFTFKYLKYLISIADNKDEIKKAKAQEKEEKK